LVIFKEKIYIFAIDFIIFIRLTKTNLVIMLVETQEFINRAMSLYRSHGYASVKVSSGELMMLVVSDISRVVDIYSGDDIRSRLDLSADYVGGDGGRSDYARDTMLCDAFADVAIRLYLSAGIFNIRFGKYVSDLDMHEEFSEMKGNGGLSFLEKSFVLCSIVCQLLAMDGVGAPTAIIGGALSFLECWCEDMGIDLPFYVERRLSLLESK
jgi:hypothetical protein